MAFWAIRDKSYSLSTRVIFHEKNEEHIFDEKPVIFLVQSAETRSIKGMAPGYKIMGKVI